MLKTQTQNKIAIETINVVVTGTGTSVLSSLMLENEMIQLPFDKFTLSSKSRKYRENLSKVINLSNKNVHKILANVTSIAKRSRKSSRKKNFIRKKRSINP